MSHVELNRVGVHCGQSAVSDNPLGTSLLTGAGALISRKDCSGSPRLFRYAVRYDRDGVVTRAARCDQSFDLLKHMITMVVCLPTAEPGQQRRAEIAAFLQKNSTVREPA